MSAILGSVLFFLIAPGVIAGLLPWWLSRWHIQAPILGFGPIRVVGFLLVVAGIALLVDCFVRFALQGEGTPAPVAPPRRLVVKGAYRYVRNPIYVAVLAIIAGQGLVLGDVVVLAYAVVVWICCHLFVVAYEEPTLRRTFGREYEIYYENVPRWIPGLRPWRTGTSQN